MFSGSTVSKLRHRIYGSTPLLRSEACKLDDGRPVHLLVHCNGEGQGDDSPGLMF